MKSEICNLLNDLNSSGKFAHYEVIENPVNPGLHVAKYGSVGLPITHDAIDILFEHADSVHLHQGVAVFEEHHMKFVNFQCEAALKTAQKRLCDGLFGGKEHSLANPRLLLSRTTADLSDILQNTPHKNTVGTVLITLPAINAGVQLQLANVIDNDTLLGRADQCFSSLETAWLHDTKVGLELHGPEQNCFAAVVYDILDTHTASEAQPGTYADLLSSDVESTSELCWTAGLHRLPAHSARRTASHTHYHVVIPTSRST